MPITTIASFFTNNPEYLIGGGGLLGLIFGSFFNVVIYRLPIMLKKEWLEGIREFLQELYGSLPEQLKENPPELRSEPFNLVTPNSSCPNCQHEIRWHENIPVISYLLLKGRCAECKTKISPRYPIIELITGILSGFVAYKTGFDWSLVALLIFTWALICLTMIDFDTQLLPDQITLPLMWLGLLINLYGGFTDIKSALLGAVGGYLSLWSFYWLFKLIRNKEGMGYGDFKLFAALGAWMGYQMLPVIILMSSVVGSIVGLSLILFKNHDKDTHIPFGPYLAIAGWIAFFWGDAIIRFTGLAAR